MDNLLQSIIEKDLVKGVPIPEIVAKYHLEDTDTLYEIIYAKSDWVEPGFTPRQSLEKWRIEACGRVERIVDTIRRIVEKDGGPLSIMEQGSGNGSTAYRLFSSLGKNVRRLDAIELTEAGTIAAQEKYKQVVGLNFFQGDVLCHVDYEDGAKTYDVVYHINVLEHVLDFSAFLDAGLARLKPGGYLVFMCPSLRYWIFWGWAKFLACSLLRVPFRTHSVSEWEIGAFFKSRKCEVLQKEFFKVLPPSRVFRYMTPQIIRTLGAVLPYCEKWAPFGIPCLQQFWVVRKPCGKPGTSFLKTHLFERRRKVVFIDLLLGPLGLGALAILWTLSSVFLAMEVARGKKMFFEQC